MKQKQLMKIFVSVILIGAIGAIHVIANPADGTKEIYGTTEDGELYTSVDIGTTTVGSTIESEGVYTFEGSGAGISGTSDGFRYIYQNEISGEIEMIARLDAFTAENNDALAGLVIRQSTDPGSFLYGIFITKGGVITGKYRNNPDWSWSGTVATPITLPIWLKITKGTSPNNIVTTYTSTDGVTWTQRWQDWMQAKFVEPLTAGFAISASQNGSLASATFSNVDWPIDPPKPVYTLTTSALNGSITLDPSGPEFEEGTVVTLTAIPDNEYEFTGWGGDLIGNTNPTTITIDSDKSISANFTLVNYTLTTEAENGTITFDPEGGVYESGTDVILTAVPNDEYEFTGWSGDLSGMTNPATITMVGDKTITATFALVSYSLTAVAGENGSITFQPAGGVYESGTVVTISAVPSSEYEFTGWSGDLSGDTNPATITIDGDKSIGANFTIVSYTLTINTQNGTVTLDPEGGLYESGSVVTITAVPADNYIFDVWSGDLSGDTNPAVVTMDGDKVVSAGFTLTTSIWDINSSGQNMIHQNYPNPFTSYTNIPYQLKQEGDIEITITDITGRTVWNISKQAQSPGNHIIQWNADDMSGQQAVKGIYFLKIQITTPVERFTGAKKLVIM